MLPELAIRFCVGGLFVSAFSLISDLFKPKTFAGLFGAAPSVALASLLVTVFTSGKPTAVINARAMLLGAVALMAYAATLSYACFRRDHLSVVKASLGGLLLWLAVAAALWGALLR